jgi:hypothetical protein
LAAAFATGFAAGLAAGFFAVAMSISLINLQRALDENHCASSDPWGWAGSQHHERGSTKHCRHERVPKLVK